MNEVTLVWRHGRFRPHTLKDWQTLRSLKCLDSCSVTPEQYDAVLQELGQYGYGICAIGGPED